MGGTTAGDFGSLAVKRNWQTGLCVTWVTGNKEGCANPPQPDVSPTSTFPPTRVLILYIEKQSLLVPQYDMISVQLGHCPYLYLESCTVSNHCLLKQIMYLNMLFPALIIANMECVNLFHSSGNLPLRVVIACIQRETKDQRQVFSPYQFLSSKELAAFNFPSFTFFPLNVHPLLSRHRSPHPNLCLSLVLGLFLV